MIVRKILPLTLLLSALLAMPTIALGQSSAGTNEGTVDDGRRSDRAGARNARRGRRQRRDRRPVKQRMRDAKKLVKKMDRLLTKTNTRLEKARENKDVIQINCVNEKLSTMKGLLRIGEQAFESAEDAASQRNQDLLNHELAKIKIAAMRVENLSLEVEGCVGETSAYLGTTVADVEVAEETRVDNPSVTTATPIFSYPNVLRPAPVSGSK